jgi:hypothetical protein
VGHKKEKPLKNLPKLDQFITVHKLEVKTLTKKWGADSDFQIERQRNVKRRFDALSSDYRFDNREHLFRVNVFYFVIDKITVQIKTRFAGMQVVKNYFGFLEPRKIINIGTGNGYSRPLFESQKKIFRSFLRLIRISIYSCTFINKERSF